MKSGKTLNELAAEITRQSESKRDAIVAASELGVATLHDSGVTNIEFGDDDNESFDLLPNAHRNLAHYVGMPTPWYDTLRAAHRDWRANDEMSLFDLTVNTILWAKPEGDKRLVRTLDGHGRALLSERYRPIDHLPILTSVLPVLMDVPGINWDQASLEVTDNRLYLKVVNQRLTADIKVGDPVQAGVIITNSEVGLGAFRVQPMLYVLRCTNGMITADQSRSKHHIGGVLGDDDGAAYEWLQEDTINARNEATVKEMRDVVKAALHEVMFERAVERARGATEVKLTGDPVKSVEWVTDKFRFTEQEQAGVLRQLIEGADLSLWGVVNAVTAYAQADDVTYDRSTEMEAVGGKLLALPAPDVKALATAGSK